MALKSWGIPQIPPETVRAAHAVFPKKHIYIFLRDRLGTIYQDDLFADLYPQRGRPTYAPWRLALVTVFQFIENLTDRQAADAVRSRLDWKYAATALKYLIQALTTCAMSRSNLSLTQSADETQRRFLRTTNLPDAERLKGT